MTLTRWYPRRNDNELTSLRTQMDRLFEDFLTPVRQDFTLTPPVDVEETADGYVFRADLPGIEAKDVKITVHGDTLTLRGERKREEKKSDGSLHRVERSYGEFERSFQLGMPVRADQVKASYRNGVLEIHVPKAEEAKVREIEVRVE
jgi:HSP20 family protein